MIDPDAIRGLLTAIELKDAATAAHTWRVTLYARALAESRGILGDRLRRVTLGAALHDVGKIDIDDAVLRKAGRLNEDEFEVIRSHPVRGHDRLRSMGLVDPDILGMVRSHHERWDGGGYPDGITGDAIPVGARFLAVIDVFDALTSVRPYRDQVGDEAAERALRAIREGRGSAFCPECVDAFEELYRSGAATWILHYFNDGEQTVAFSSIEHLDEALRALAPPRHGP